MKRLTQWRALSRRVAGIRKPHAQTLYGVGTLAYALNRNRQVLPRALSSLSTTLGTSLHDSPSSPRRNPRDWRSRVSRISYALASNPVRGSSAKLAERYRAASSAGISSVRSNTATTIYALSTPPGRAAIAIIRCSGPLCLDIYASLCPGKPAPQPRQATLRTLYSPGTHREVLDPGALILFLPAPNTVTGEDVLELHVHGGTAVVRAVLGAIPAAAPKSTTSRPAISYAEPGEFTQRAFANSRLSLPQVEALAATLSASTEQQHRAAVAAHSGALPLADRYESWRGHLVAARGELEALIDFSEDQAFDESATRFLTSVSTQVRALRARLKAHAANAARGELLREGISVALVGAPNAGKSSLLNAVVGRAAAIVSAEPGTTRDVLDISVDIGGYACLFGDLAGLRGHGTTAPSLRRSTIRNEAHTASHLGAVEREGIRRAKARALSARVVIIVVPCAADGSVPTLDTEVYAALEQLNPLRQRVLVALNKTDLLSRPVDQHVSAAAAALRAALPPAFRNVAIAPISCLSETASSGVQPLLERLATTCAELTSPLSAEGAQESLPHDEAHAASAWDLGPPDSASLALGASERHRLLLEEALRHMAAFLDEAAQSKSENEALDDDTVSQSFGYSRGSGNEPDVVVAAEHLRAAATCLGRVAGRGAAGDVDEVLGVVFEKFCVGK